MVEIPEHYRSVWRAAHRRTWWYTLPAALLVGAAIVGLLVAYFFLKQVLPEDVIDSVLLLMLAPVLLIGVWQLHKAHALIRHLAPWRDE